MKTIIGTSFGLALLSALGVLGAMLALGVFITSKAVRATTLVASNTLAGFGTGATAAASTAKRSWWPPFAPAVHRGKGLDGVVRRHLFGTSAKGIFWSRGVLDTDVDGANTSDPVRLTPVMVGVGRRS